MSNKEIYYHRIIEGYLSEVTDGRETHGYALDGEDLGNEFQEFEGKLVRITIEVLESLESEDK